MGDGCGLCDAWSVLEDYERMGERLNELTNLWIDSQVLQHRPPITEPDVLSP